uniref:Uncharacterized protein n=1 Tax=Ciona savignyi TaxID=51511 RepID=H2YSU3_CIOSA
EDNPGKPRRQRSPTNSLGDDSAPSDSESNKYTKVSSTANKYSDEAETITKTKTTTKTERRTSRKVDLGAAASYTGGNNAPAPVISAPTIKQPTTPAANNNASLLNDIFSPT